jgi:hypothetical protein
VQQYAHSFVEGAPVTTSPDHRLRTAVPALSSLALGLLVPVAVAGSATAAATKASICHATNSHSNPYRRISVSQSALIAHYAHRGTGVVWSPGITTKWDDVVPGGSPNGKLIWDSTRIAIYEGTATTPAGRLACRGMSTKAYYDSEIAAGVPQAAVLADLNTQRANEDAALLGSAGRQLHRRERRPAG